MRALVTGGAGFIGSTLVDRLLAAGHTVGVVDNLATGILANLEAARAAAGERLSFYEVDVVDDRLRDVVVDLRPEVVYHLAAQADVRVSVADPVFDARVNLIGGLNVLEAAREAGARKIVFASSGGTIYGDPDPSLLPLDEKVAQRPISPYGVAKKAFTDYLEAARQLGQIDYTSLALANVYGPRQDPHGEAGVVAIFAGKLLAGEPCTIYGTGGQTRDFVYVGDVARAFEAATDVGSGELLNIGTGVELSVNDLYLAMRARAGADAEPLSAPARPGELERSALDSTRAGEVLGWRPEVALEDGVSRVLDWFRTRTP